MVWRVIYETISALNDDTKITVPLKKVAQEVLDAGGGDGEQYEKAEKRIRALAELARNKYEGVSDKFREDKERILSGDEDAGRWSVGMGRRNRRIWVQSEDEQNAILKYNALKNGGVFGGQRYESLEEKKERNELKIAKMKRERERYLARRTELTVVSRRRLRQAIGGMQLRIRERKQAIREQEVEMERLEPIVDAVLQKQGTMELSGEKFEINLVGRSLLRVLPFDTDPPNYTRVDRANAQRLVWNNVIRAFQLPADGETYEERRSGELELYSHKVYLQEFEGVEYKICFQLFDVGVVPSGSGGLFNSLRIYGRRFMSDPAFVRMLIGLSIQHGGLPAGALQSEEHNAANVHRCWRVNVKKENSGAKAFGEQELRKRALLVAGEVAARRVRGMLGRNMQIARSKSSARNAVPAKFQQFRDSVEQHVPRLVDWRYEVMPPLGVEGLSVAPIPPRYALVGLPEVVWDPPLRDTQPAQDWSAPWLCGLHNMLLGTLRKMAGLEPDAGVKPLDDVWARATADNLCNPGTFPYRSRRIAIVNMPTRHYGLEGTMFPDWVVEFHVKSINTMKSERALREIHKYQADNVFGHLYDRVLHIEGHDFHNRMQRMKLFLEKKDCNVALCFYGHIDYARRYQILYKDQRKSESEDEGTLWLIDPMAKRLSPGLEAVERGAIKNEAQAAAAQGDPGSSLPKEWTVKRMGRYRDPGQDDRFGFLTALTRALVLALAAKRVAENGARDAQEYGARGYPILGEEDFENDDDDADDDAGGDDTTEEGSYIVWKDYASATSDLAWGFGPMCLSLAALVHNAHTIGRTLDTDDDYQGVVETDTWTPHLYTRRVEVWDTREPLR